MGFVRCRESLVEEEVVPVPGCALLIANPWPLSGSHSEGDEGSTECKFLVGYSRSHSQRAAKLVPILARGRTMPGCRAGPSTGEGENDTKELNSINVPQVNVSSTTCAMPPYLMTC